MFYKTISKKIIFVISLFSVCSILTNCNLVSPPIEGQSSRSAKKLSDRFDKPKVIGTIKTREIKESSGLVNSRCNPEILWTHNDSGNRNHIYALDKTGKKLGTWRVDGAGNIDWEDLATLKNKTGECFLYIGDIGNNSRLRATQSIYKVKEPKVTAEAKSSDDGNPLLTDRAEQIKFTYPDIRHDAEALLIHPETEDIYILTKSFSGASGIYKLSGYELGETQKLVQVGSLSLPALPNGVVTGGEISPDGRRVIICDYFNGYELKMSEKDTDFDQVWKDEPSIIELGEREQGEAICYSSDAGAIYATSEKKDSPVIEVKRK